MVGFYRRARREKLGLPAPSAELWCTEKRRSAYETLVLAPRGRSVKVADGQVDRSVINRSKRDDDKKAG